MAQQTVNIVSTPGGPRCLAGATGAGLVAGGYTGGEVGLVGLAGGGVTVGVTEPAGLLIGGAGGAATGFTAGLALCSSGTGGGGGGGGGGGSNAKAAKKLSTAKADEAARKGGYQGAEDLKKAFVGERGSQYDLYKQPNGDVEIFAKGGVGEGIETGINIKN